MVKKFRDLLGTDCLGITVISLLSSSLAPSTYTNCDSALRHCFSFCAVENLPLESHPRYHGPLHCLARPTRHRHC
jgi:NAD(P)H-dependent FMN reductase